MRLALIGYMASGKTTVARELAMICGVEVVSTDQLALQISGRQSIRDIFELDGEPLFRDYETRALQQALTAHSGILDLGGGIVEREQNRSLLRTSNIPIIWLRVDFETAKARASADNSRPLFDNKSTARELFQKRQHLYESIATHIQDNSTPTPPTTQILRKLSPTFLPPH